MILYKFGYYEWRDKFEVREIEVEEKEKCYVGNSIRVLKSEINKLTSSGAMYCLENNPSTFIDALSEQNKSKLRYCNKKIRKYKEELKKFDDWKKECK